MKFTVNPNCRQFGQHAVASNVGHAQFNCLLLPGGGAALSDTKSARNALMAQYEFKNQLHERQCGRGAWHPELGKFFPSSFGPA